MRQARSYAFRIEKRQRSINEAYFTITTAEMFKMKVEVGIGTTKEGLCFFSNLRCASR